MTNCCFLCRLFWETANCGLSTVSQIRKALSPLSDRPSPNFKLSEDTKVVSQASRDSTNNFNHKVWNFEIRFKPEVNLPSANWIFSPLRDSHNYGASSGSIQFKVTLFSKTVSRRDFGKILMHWLPDSKATLLSEISQEKSLVHPPPHFFRTIGHLVILWDTKGAAGGKGQGLLLAKVLNTKPLQDAWKMPRWQK